MAIPIVLFGMIGPDGTSALIIVLGVLAGIGAGVLTAALIARRQDR